MPSKTIAPLAGIRVVDLSWVLAGPVAGRLLADAGAEVIKVESRGHLDNTRRGKSVAPGGSAPDAALDPIDRVPLFHNLNAGKKSVGIDLASPTGVAVVKRLIRASDVVLENFAPGVMARLGLAYEVLCADHPQLIMVSLSGTGQDGPLSDIPAYAPTVTSLSGLESIVAYPGEAPLGIMGLNLADSFGGLYGFHAVLNALWARKKHGIGQHVDYSELEGVCTLLAEPIADYHMNGRVMAPSGNESSQDAPYGIFPVEGVDRWVSIAVVGDGQWRSFCAATSGASWCTDVRLAGSAGRLAGKVELESALAEYTRSLAGDELVARLQQAGIAAAPVYGPAEQVADAHFRARGLFRQIDVEGLGPHLIYGAPWQLGATPTVPTTGAPRLGQHTREVMREMLGMDEAAIDALVATGALQVPLSAAELDRAARR